MEKQEQAFHPLRKLTKNSKTGSEDNFMRAYNRKIDDREALTATPPGLFSETEHSAAEVRAKYGIKIEGDNCPGPISAFHELGDYPLLHDYLSERNVLHPTPIQMQALSCMVAGRDVVGLSETGSGKSLSYILPLYLLLSQRKPQVQFGNPVALILVPTRELMQQIATQCQDFISLLNRDYWGQHNIHGHQDETMSRHNNLSEKLSMANDGPMFRLVCVYGGVPLAMQIMELRRNVTVVVATPGRLLHLVDKKEINLQSVSFLVIDECDRMLDMGMEEQLRKIVALATVSQIPRQTSLWSATLPESLERLARSAVLNAIVIQVGFAGDIPACVLQDVIPLHSYQKPEVLLKVLRGTPYPPVIVFSNTAGGVDEIEAFLKKEQFHVASLHSEKTQEYRFLVIGAFKEGDLDVLVATDLASRGLDIPEITHIVNYDLPYKIEDYVHRCGRTGRYGRPGYATSFLTLDCKIAAELKTLLMNSGNKVPMALADTKQYGKRIVRTEMGDRVVH